MTRDIDHPPDDDRLRSAFNQLAAGARSEPSRPLQLRGSSTSDRRGRRVGYLAAAAVVLVVVAVGAALARRGPNEVVAVGPFTESDLALFVNLAPDSVTNLPDAPISGRIGPASVWTGKEMIIWGGSELVSSSESPLSDGAAFDPATGSWRLLSEAPIEGRAYAATVWTGTEMVVWGGSRSGTFVGDGAAYNPTSNTWRVLAEGPLEPAMKSATVWTGSEMIIVGGLNLGGASAAYDPITDSWRPMPDAPARVTPPYPHAVWTGEAVLTTVTDEGPSGIQLAMYRPDVDEWEVVQEQFSSQFLVGVPGVDLGMVGDEVVALTFAPDASLPVLSLFGDVGLDLQPKPTDLEAVAIWQPIWTGHEILLWSGNSAGLALDPLADQWREFPAGDVANRVDGAIVWADGVMIAWGGFASNRDGTSSAANDGVIYKPVSPPDTTASTAPSPSAPIDTTTGCPEDHAGNWTPGPDGFTDYVDFVRYNGRMYSQSAPSDISPTTLGELIAQVCFTLGDMTFNGPAPIQDGDASFLPTGTELRAIPGANPELRLAAVVESQTIVYEVLSVDDATVGSDLIDLGATITEIGVNSDFDGRRIAAITDQATVTQLVDLLANAPADLSPRPDSERDGQRYFIELVRSDGTSTTRAYWIETGELSPGIDLPPEWRDAIEAAL